MLPYPVTLESVVRGFGEFRQLFRALEIYDTARGRALDEGEKEEAVNGFLDTGAPQPVLFSLPGLGDSILLTAVARRMRERTGRPCLAASSHAPLFRGSKDVSHVLLNYDLLQRAPQFTDFLLQLDLAPVFTAYWVRRMAGGRRTVVSPDCHMITHMCRTAGLTGRVTLRPWVEDMPAGPLPPLPKGREYVIIQSEGVPWKHWGGANFQAVAERLKGRFLLIQVDATAREPGLDGALDLRGKLGLPELARIMRGARLFLGNEGGLAHLARAVDTKAVLAMSSYLDPAVTGYAANVNITAERPCRLCATGRIKVYKGEPCPEGFRCMNIPLEAVLRGVEKALDDPSMPVETQRIPEPAAAYSPVSHNVFEQWFAE